MKKDKTTFNRILMAIGVSGITIVAGFWISFLLYNIVMT